MSDTWKHYTYQPMTLRLGVPSWRTEIRVNDEPVYCSRVELVQDFRDGTIDGTVVTLTAPLFGDGQQGPTVDVIEGVLIPKEQFEAFREWQRAEQRAERERQGA